MNESRHHNILNAGRYYHLLAAIMIFSFFSFNLYSQTADTLQPPKSVVVVDSEHPTKSSTEAVLLSLALPGLGQIYNQSYWKTPIILGFAGYFAYTLVQENKLYHQYQTDYQITLDPTSKRARDFYHNERDRFGWYLGVTYVLNAVDAYVDAQLFDFDVGTSMGKYQEFPVQKITMKFYFDRRK